MERNFNYFPFISLLDGEINETLLSDDEVFGILEKEKDIVKGRIVESGNGWQLMDFEGVGPKLGVEGIGKEEEQG